MQATREREDLQIVRNANNPRQPDNIGSPSERLLKQSSIGNTIWSHPNWCRNPRRRGNIAGNSIMIQIATLSQ